LKTYAADAADALNASMEFDPETLRPRFRLIVGVPGLSRALEVARGLGVDPDVLARAESLIPEEERRAGSLLRDIESLRRQAGDEAEAARGSRAAAEESLARAESLMASVRGEEAALRQGALEQSRELIRETRRYVEQVRAEIRAERRGARAREAVSRAVRRLEEREAALEKAAPAPSGPRVDPSRLVPGTRWWAEALGDFVTLLDGPDRHDKVRVRRGAMTVRLSVSALSERSEGAAPVLPQGVTLTSPVRASYESDVRGLTADEAAAVVDKHLDTALLGGLREIKVIHGMGTGVLLATVRGILSQHPRVKSFRSGESREGGAGVTIAELED
jgi:DNA mismatch repair protein MutS2